MAEKKKEFERIEWILPVSAEEPGTRDTVIAFSYVPSRNESYYVIRRSFAPRQVEVWGREDVSYRMRRRPTQYYLEIRDRDGTHILRKHLIPIEAAYIEWRDADNQVLDFDDAFPDHPELLALQDQNPVRPNPGFSGGGGSSYEKNAEAFLHGQARDLSRDRMVSEKDRLFSYGTVIAQHLPDGKIVFNATRYSPTTSSHQAVALRVVHPDYVVHHVPIGARDLTPYVARRRVIATSGGKWGRTDLLMYPLSSGLDAAYELEFYDPQGRYVRTEMLEPTKTRGIPMRAYIEYIDADKLLVPFNEAFPQHPELRSTKRKYLPGRPNPRMGKRSFWLPFEQWHAPATRLIAISYIDSDLGTIEMDVYRTRTGRYIRQLGRRRGEPEDGFRRSPWFWRYISKPQAVLDWRDADMKMASYAEAFEEPNPRPTLMPQLLRLGAAA